jgi:hypothetical protein
MMNFILNKPIIAALIFIVLFELYFQHQHFVLAYLLCVYIILKSFGLTDVIKRFVKKIIQMMFNKHLDNLKKNLLDIEIMFKDENGVLEARYYFQKNKNDYLVSVTKDSDKITILLYGEEIVNSPLIFIDDSFHVTKPMIIKYLEVNYFDKLEW